MFGAELLEKCNRLGGVFQQAERFGFEAEVQFASGFSLTRAMCSTQRQRFSRISVFCASAEG